MSQITRLMIVLGCASTLALSAWFNGHDATINTGYTYKVISLDPERGLELRTSEFVANRSAICIIDQAGKLGPHLYHCLKLLCHTTMPSFNPKPGKPFKTSSQSKSHEELVCKTFSSVREDNKTGLAVSFTECKHKSIFIAIGPS